jgi:hypothetical protein
MSGPRIRACIGADRLGEHGTRDQRCECPHACPCSPGDSRPDSPRRDAWIVFFVERRGWRRAAQLTIIDFQTDDRSGDVGTLRPQGRSPGGSTETEPLRRRDSSLDGTQRLKLPAPLSALNHFDFRSDARFEAEFRDVTVCEATLKLELAEPVDEILVLTDTPPALYIAKTTLKDASDISADIASRTC